ncbi:hypothetical protein [Pyxidicoccus trucidator]|uniref:hypothetical protein n=1 Tax=Pyxidicoccus trucidator TaxID=2709662 RepID=UPI0013DCD40A|nr:hypothetical protein [Pyxidicoccus trucidator]
MALSVFTLTAHAQSVKPPATKNPHFRSIARHYNKTLDYEAAVELLPKARAYSGNKNQEHLWLDLMSGVLHYSLKDTAASEAAFKSAFDRAPDAPLPIKNPSQTLVQRFEELRKAHALERASKQSPSPQSATPSPPKPISKIGLLAKLRELEAHAQAWARGPLPAPLAAAFRSIYDQAVQAHTPSERIALGKTIDTWIRLFKSGDAKGVNDLAEETAPVKHNTPAPATPDLHSGSETGFDPLRRAISADVLHERVRRMREWLVVKSERASTPQVLKLLTRLNELLSSLEASETAHERMLIAINLDVLEVQMSIHLGWQIQGSDPKVITLESE